MLVPLARRKLSGFLLSLLFLTGCSHLLEQESLLRRMRSQYYDLSGAGLSSFHCEVRPDWDTFLTSVEKHAPAPSPWHTYLSQGYLVFTEPMRGAPQVQWLDPAAPPPGKEAPAKQEADAFEHMLHGFLTAWQPSLNGTLLPVVPISEISAANGGYALTEHDLQGRISDISLDSTLRITHIKTRGPNLHADTDTQYVNSPKGLLLTEMNSINVNEKSGVSQRSLLRTSYAEMEGFQVPATLLLLSQEGTQVPMQFKNCGIKR